VPYLRIDLWPAGVVLAIAALLLLALRVLEGVSHRNAKKRTREALQHALRGSTEE
jgi:hypothetical protein